MLETGALLSALAADSEAFADLATDLGAAVPPCPGWTVSDLVGHLGGVYSWATAALEAGGERPSSPRATPPDDPAAVVPWFLERRAAVLGALTAREPDAPAWNFTRQEGTFTVGWWRRRQALETSIHLFDLEEATGTGAPIDPELAADGVDEYLTAFLAIAARTDPGPLSGVEGTLHVHCTDTEGEWVVDFSGPAPVTRREHAKADTAIRGPASDLFLWVWNRRPLDGLEVFGGGGTVRALGDLKL